MYDWTTDPNFDPNKVFPCKWEYWTLSMMRACVEKTEELGVNFRDIEAWKQYLAAKLAGGWGPSPMTVCTDRNQCAVDGLNRFKSDIEGGTRAGRWYPTVRNWSAEQDRGIDRGKLRTPTQWFAKHAAELDMGSKDVASVKWAIMGGAGISRAEAKIMDPELILSAVKAWPEAFEAVFARPKMKGFTAPMRGAFIRANGSIPDLEVAIDLMITGNRPDGVSEERASSILRLRTFALSLKGNQGGGVAQLAQYQKAASALVAWGKGVPLTQLHPTVVDPFDPAPMKAIWDGLTNAVVGNR